MVISTVASSKKIMFSHLFYLIRLTYGVIDSVRFDYRNGQCFINLKSFNDVFAILFFFKNHSKTLFLSLVDFTVVDLLSFNLDDRPLTKKFRFQLFYFLLSHYFNLRLIVCVNIKDDSFAVTSLFGLYKSAPWLEREVWDMFGIFFLNHPDLRRILTDYGFDGFPLRKDFPITGYSEVRYDEIKKCIVYESLELTQELRVFDTLSPWFSLL